MSILDRHLLVTVATHFASALATLLAIFGVIRFAEELERLDAAYTLGDASIFVLLMLPAEAYDLLPAAAVLGGVSGIGSLAHGNEILALWSAGVAPRRLLRPVVTGGLLLGLVALLVGELVAIPLGQLAWRYRAERLGGGQALGTAGGLWIRDGNRFIHVRQPLPDGDLADVAIYGFDDGRRLVRFLTAARGRSTDEGWHLEDLTEWRIGAEGAEIREIPEATWTRVPPARELARISLPPDLLSLGQLSATVLSVGERGESPLAWRSALWRRVSTAVLVAVLLFVSVPFVLVVLRSGALGTRIVAGGLAGIGFQMANELVLRFGLVYGVEPLLTAALPAGAALLVGLALLRRIS